MKRYNCRIQLRDVATQLHTNFPGCECRKRKTAGDPKWTSTLGGGAIFVSTNHLEGTREVLKPIQVGGQWLGTKQGQGQVSHCAKGYSLQNVHTLHFWGTWKFMFNGTPRPCATNNAGSVALSPETGACGALGCPAHGGRMHPGRP